MKTFFHLLCIHRKKRLATKVNRRRRRVIQTRRNSSFCPNPTSSSIDVPLDLQINSLLRLPVKSTLRFRCVSKLWSSIITSQYFKNQHLNITSSSAPPRLLISFRDFFGEKLMLVSSPNPNPNPNATSSCVPYKDLNLVKMHGTHVYNSARGSLICIGSRLKVGICNPSTRQVHIFPKINGNLCIPVTYFLGYDPIEDQYKILAVNHFVWRLEHKVIVLGGREKEAWREVPCVDYPHIARTLGLYMNGTIYYGASRKKIDNNNNSKIVSFDVRSETFNNINLPKHYDKMWKLEDITLINYQGKLRVIETPRRNGSFRFWVLEDTAKKEWSTNIFHLPKSCVGLAATIH